MKKRIRLIGLGSVLIVAVLTGALARAGEKDEPLQGWQVWQQNCATRCHTGLQMPKLPDNPDQIKTVIRQMRGIGNFPEELVEALEQFLLEEED